MLVVWTLPPQLRSQRRRGGPHLLRIAVLLTSALPLAVRRSTVATVTCSTLLMPCGGHPIGGWWQLTVGGGWWRLVVGGGWRLAVGGPWGLS